MNNEESPKLPSPLTDTTGEKKEKHDVEAFREPDFGTFDSEVETPFKGHDASSGMTPGGERGFAWRVAQGSLANGKRDKYGNLLTLQPGLPGWSASSPVKLFK